MSDKKTVPQRLAKITAQEWARDLVQNAGLFYVLDTETTGLGKDDEIVQIALINQSGIVIENELVKPKKPIPIGASAVHGIKDVMVAHSPTIKVIWSRLMDTLRDSVIVAYNMEFDWRMLTQTARIHGLPPLQPRRRDCAMLNYAAYRGEWNRHFKNWKWHKLSKAIAHEKLNVADAHSATGDALMTLNLIHHIASIEQGTE